MIPTFSGTLTITGGHTPPPVLKIEPDDLIIISSQNSMTQNQMRTLQQGAKSIWPDHKIIVLADGLTLTTAREAPSQQTLSEFGILTPL